MDRRQKKTRDAIFHAFSKLLAEKKYKNITVQEIIDYADIGRSTFYAHFETKDDLLKELCSDIFQHVLHDLLPEEENPEGSSGYRNLELKLGHILFHLKGNKINLKRIIISDIDGPFTEYFKEYLKSFFAEYLYLFSDKIPAELITRYLTGSFIETIRWWFSTGTEYTAEETAGMYISLLSIYKKPDSK